MSNEAPHGPSQKAHSRNDAGGRGDEQSPLQARAAFIENWSWELIVSLNRGACQRGRAQHGYNSEAHQKVRDLWEETRPKELSLSELLDLLFRCHRSAPFLFFNGNTFAEVARRTVDLLFADLPLSRRREAASLAAHFVAGVLDRDLMLSGIESVCEAADFAVGDRVRTLRGSATGVVLRVQADGKIIWRPNGSRSELIALPESLLREKRGL
jgi:hypothetical protein